MSPQINMMVEPTLVSQYRRMNPSKVDSENPPQLTLALDYDSIHCKSIDNFN